MLLLLLSGRRSFLPDPRAAAAPATEQLTLQPSEDRRELRQLSGVESALVYWLVFPSLVNGSALMVCSQRLAGSWSWFVSLRSVSLARVVPA